MARYMLTENAFLPDGYLHEASLGAPKVIVTPDDLIPSLKWMPLDQAAKAALDAICQEKQEIAFTSYVQSGMEKATARAKAKREFRVKPMPPNAEKIYIPAEQIKQVEIKRAKTPDEIEQEAFMRLAEKSAPGVNAAAEFARALAEQERPSDTEPT